MYVHRVSQRASVSIGDTPVLLLLVLLLVLLLLVLLLLLLLLLPTPCVRRVVSRYAVKVKQLQGLNANIYYKLLDSLFRIVLFTESGNEWSLSKPILSLMLADRASFDRLRKYYVETQAINAAAQVRFPCLCV